MTASTMLGLQGAQAMLFEKLDHEVPCIPCQVHRSNTVMEHSSAASSIVTSMFEILEALYVLFSSNTKRHSVLTAPLQKVENALLLRNLSKTRLSARAESIRAVWVYFECIILNL